MAIEQAHRRSPARSQGLNRLALASRLWLRAARRGCALLVLAVLALAAQAGVEEGVKAYRKRDYANAIRELLPAAQSGDAEAQAYVGQMLLDGFGVAKDEARAAEWITKAAEQGHAHAQDILGSMYLVGRGVPRDEAQAVEWVRRAAEQGHPTAQFHYAAALARGLGGLTRDDQAAFTWFTKAAQQGHRESMTRVGLGYLRGVGVAKSDQEALSWLRKAAAGNDPSGQYELGMAYAKGEAGLVRDIREATAWFQQAASRGYPLSQAALGKIYEDGAGVPIDYVFAYAWYSLALANGVRDKLVAERRDALAQKMTAAQIADAQARARLVQTAIRAQAEPAPAPAAQPDRQSAAAAPASSGTGFIVAQGGYIVTNHHVVAGCKSIRVLPGNVEATVIEKDPINDLAILKAARSKMKPLAIRGDGSVRPGDEIVVAGFPLRFVLSGAIVTTGSVSALSGPGNNTGQLQIAAPVQPGNSGGSVLDRHGLVVGVVQSKINALAMAKITGDIPQNINFAINAAALKSFLDAGKVPYLAASRRKAPMGNSAVADLAKQSTLAVECHR